MTEKQQERAQKKYTHFRDVVSPRVDKAIEAIDRVGRCGNRAAYDYSEEDTEKVFGALQDALNDARSNYTSKGRKKREPFSLAES